MIEAFPEQCDELRVWLPEAIMLIFQPDRGGGGAAPTLPRNASKPPWNSQAANAAHDADAAIRDIEAELCEEVTGQQRRHRGGSWANTFAAIQAMRDLAVNASRGSATDGTHRLHHLVAPIKRLPANDADERFVRIHGVACHHCGNTMLRLGERSARVTCVRWGACFDHDGLHPSGFVTTGLNQVAMVAWADGCNQYAQVTPVTVLALHRYQSLLARLIITPSGCWEWTGARDRRGYGRAGYGPRKAGTGLVHRMVYQQVNGPIDDGLELDHLCRNPPCANPAHLEPVTHRENVRRGDGPTLLGARNAAVTHCPQGHPYDEINTFRRPSGARECRICMRHRNWQRPSRRQQ